jgi:hypothetical protein
MVKYLPLLLLLISPTSYAQQCTYSLTALGHITNVQCTGIEQNVALRLYWCPSRPTDPVCPPLVICSPSSVVEDRPCPVNFSGTTTWRRDTTCPSSAWGSPVTSGWIQIANSCTPMPPTCQASTDTRTETCGANQNGQKTYSRTNICPDPYGQQIQGPWILNSNSCTFNPPTCNPTSQTQSLSCQGGYVGAVMQNRSSVCPDPYGQPVWSPWVTTADTCVKSAMNPTNMSSVLNPVSPISPLNPNQTSKTGLPISMQDLLLLELLNSEEDSSNEEAIQESTQTQLARPAARGKILIPGLGMALSLSTFVNKVIKQDNVFPVTSINQSVPEDYINSGQFFMDIYGVSLPDQSRKFDALKQDAVELEQ